MRRTFIAVITLLALTSCQTEQRPLPTELPFATHPSVLRGNWSGTIFNVPESKNSTLALTDITAQCDTYPEDSVEDTCYEYTFSGSVSIDGNPATSIDGSGYAGGYVYTLTSPVEPATPLIIAYFDFAGDEWTLLANFRSSGSLEVADESTFEGYLSSSATAETGSSFLLEPTP